jgi:glycerophosphoryl diester phosphodiesterase
MNTAIAGLRVSPPSVNYYNNKDRGITNGSLANASKMALAQATDATTNSMQTQATLVPSDLPLGALAELFNKRVVAEDKLTNPLSLQAGEKIAQTPRPRAGRGYEAAHGGDREAKPRGWKESEWENSIQAIRGAFDKDADYVELDLQLNTHPNSGAGGALYLHHNKIGEPINKRGEVIGPGVNIGTADPKEVNKVAERLDNVLAAFNKTKYPNTTFILEMKSDTGNAVQMAQAVYNAIKNSDRKDIIISSLDPQRLEALYLIAKRDGRNLNLMLVLPLYQELNKAWVDKIKADMPYVNFVAFSTDRLSFRRAEINTEKAAVDYAKSRGLFVAGWNWDYNDDIRWCAGSRKRAEELDLDINITDCLRHRRD